MFFGGYTLIPEKANVLPCNAVFAAAEKNYAGAYKARADIYEVYTGDSAGCFFTGFSIRQGSIVQLDKYGYALNNPYVDLKPYVRSGTLQVFQK